DASFPITGMSVASFGLRSSLRAKCALNGSGDLGCAQFSLECHFVPKNVNAFGDRWHRRLVERLQSTPAHGQPDGINRRSGFRPPQSGLHAYSKNRPRGPPAFDLLAKSAARSSVALDPTDLSAVSAFIASSPWVECQCFC